MPFPRANRLPLRSDKERFAESRIRLHSPLFSVVVINSPAGITSPRFGIILGKKVAREAHDRNSIRRRLSGAITPLLSQIRPADYLLLPKSTLLTSSSEELLNEIKSVFKI